MEKDFCRLGLSPWGEASQIARLASLPEFERNLRHQPSFGSNGLPRPKGRGCPDCLLPIEAADPVTGGEGVPVQHRPVISGRRVFGLILTSKDSGVVDHWMAGTV